MARLSEVQNDRNVLPFKHKKTQGVHWLTIVNTVLILCLYLIVLGK